MGQHCMLVFVGVPGSGKSHLANCLRHRQHNDYCYVHIEYDKLMPANIDESRAQNEDVSAKSLWKVCRQCVKQCVNVTVGLLKSTGDEVEECACKELKSMYKNQEMLLNIVDKYILLLKNGLSRSGPNCNVIFMLDDNMYYRSMRYEYHQLARSHRIGFCTAYLVCDIDVCLERNAERERPVPEDVILTMSAKLEPPTEPWECRHVSVRTKHSTTSDSSVAEYVHAMVSSACVEPVSAALSDQEDESAAQADREACIKSVMHQCDAILRTLVSSYVNRFKHSANNSVPLGVYAKNCNSVRTNILQCLRNRSIVLPIDVQEDFKNQRFEKLQDFTHTLFSEKIMDVDVDDKL